MLLGATPDSTKNIFLFLLSFLFALSLTLSFPIYFFLNKKSKTQIRHRQIYRKSLRVGFVVGAGIVTIMGLKAFDLVNMLNTSLFLVLYSLIFWQEIKRQ